MIRGSTRGFLILLLVVAATLSPIMSIGPDADDGPIGTGNGGTPGGGSVGPAADTNPPSFVGFSQSPDYPGPTTKVNLDLNIADESSPINVSLKYGVDNSTWTNLITKQTSGQKTFTDRNPSSGYAYGTTLTRTYDLGSKSLWYLNVYCYSADSDTLTITIRAYDSVSKTWDTLFYQNSFTPGTETKIDEYFKSKAYTKWDISYLDYENNDNIYYNCTYSYNEPVSFEVPAAGDNGIVYARFNATDPAGNTQIYVYEIRIDRNPPDIRDVTSFNYTVRSSMPIEIYTNLTDNRRITDCYINWSLDGTNWTWSEMSKVTGTDAIRKMMGSLPLPNLNNNLTVYYRIEAFDEGGNHGNSSTYDLTWNTPPWISNVSTSPYYVNNWTKVNVTAEIYDSDNITRVWFEYSAVGISWTPINATRGSGNNYSVEVPAIKGSSVVNFIWYANDSEGGHNNTTGTSYEIDEVRPYLASHGTENLFVGPDETVDVVGNVKDRNPLTNVTLQYSTDSTNWTNLSTTLRTGQATYYDRNPSTGYTSGVSISKTYVLNGKLEHLYVYCYTSDSNTMYVNIRGYNSVTRTWDTLYFQSSTTPGNEVKLDATFPTKNYTRWSIIYYDYEYDDDIFYLAKWTVSETAHWTTIPAMGSSVSTVYYRYSMIDAADNTNTSQVNKYIIDSVGPTITSHSMPSGRWNDTTDLLVYANVTDDHMIREVYINYSRDGTNWFQVRMSAVVDDITSGLYVGVLPYPRPTSNVTYRVYIDAYDYPFNKGNTTLHTFYWNPPPWLQLMSYSPLHPNNRTTVDVTAQVWDDDTLDRVWVMYSSDGQSSWDSVDATAGTGTNWIGAVPAIKGTSTVYYAVYAQDTNGNENNTVTMSYHIDETPPRMSKPSIAPTYPNASAPVKVKAAINDGVGIKTVILHYRFGSSGAFSELAMTLESGPTTSYVGGAIRYSYATYNAGLEKMGGLLGTWDSSVSTFGVNPKPALFTDMDIILLDGYGASWYFADGLTAARNGKFVVMNLANWNSARSSAGNPSYTIYTSNGFTSYIFSEGSGLVVYTYNLYNSNYLGYSYQYYSDSILSNLADHLLEMRDELTFYSVMVPKTTTSQTVEYMINATDLSNVSFLSGIFTYTTDGDAPVGVDAGGPPSPPLVWNEYTHPVWVSVTDETFLSGVKVVYSFDNGSTWQSRDMSRSSGNNQAANYTGTVPPSYTIGWVWYHYEVLDRALNWMRYPSGSEYEYRTTDLPDIANLHATPMHAPISTTITISADLTDNEGIASAYLVYRINTGTDNTITMTRGAGDKWTATITSPSYTSRMYYHLRVTDNLAMVIDSPELFIIVDNDPPTFSTSDTTPEYPNADTIILVNATVHDALTSLDLYTDYKYGASGSIQSTYQGKGGQIEVVDRLPASGTTTSNLYKLYPMPAGSIVGRVTLRVWSWDHGNCYVYFRGLKGSTWETIYLSTSTTDGIKVDKSVELSSYTQLIVSFYDVDRAPFYYNLTYTYIDTEIQMNVPPPGYTSMVYYRIRGTDEAGLSGTSAWGSYYADGTDPHLVAHKPQGMVDCNVDVSVAVTLQDEARMGRAQVFYSYGGSPYEYTNVTNTFFNTTHLGGTATLNKTRIPMSVSYYFVYWDAAGNQNTSTVYTYNTRMPVLVEGGYTIFDSTLLVSTTPYNNWEWDFDYDGSTFEMIKKGVAVRFSYLDNGSYIVALRLTDTGGNTSLRTFNVRVTDGSPVASIKYLDSVMEGTPFMVNASWSSSWPDTIAKYEWDLDYDGTTFNIDATGMVYIHTINDDGTYLIALRVTDDDGTVDMTDITVTVLDDKPTIVVTYPQTSDEGVQLSLNATGSFSWPDAMDRIEWDLDYDGSFDIDLTGILVTHTYMDNGDYQWMARAFDDDGSVTQFQGTIKVRDLVPNGTITTTAWIEEGSSLEFSGNLSTSFPDIITNYEWDFVYDGPFDIMSTGVVTYHTYMDNGSYTAALRVTDDDGSTHIATVEITVVDLGPSPALSTLSVVDEGTSFNLTSLSSSYPDHIVRVEWDFDYDGTTFLMDDVGVDVEHTFMDNGSYVVALKAVDKDGSTGIVTHEIQVNDLTPAADAIISGDFEEGKTMLLDARGSSSYPDDIALYQWDVAYNGEDFTVDLEGSIVEYIFTDNGTYIIAFRVTDDDGSRDMVVQTIDITDLGPNAVVTQGVQSYSEGTLVVFSAGSSTSSPDELVYYHWDWEGDGEIDDTTMEVNGRHTFTSPGRYEVTLTVEDDDGSTDSDSVYVTITDIGPIVKLDADPTPEGQVALLDASGTEEPGRDFVAFRWDLDADGVWDHEETCSSLEVVWNEPGMYSIRVEVEDEDGSKASKSMTLLISDVAPQVDINVPSTVDEGTLVEISGAATYEPGDDFTVFKWDVDNNGKWDVEGMLDEITWTYDVAGVYTIRLYVEDEDGSSGEGRFEIEVIDLDPVFTIEFPTDVMENVPANFTLDGLSDPGTVDFIVIWYFGDGTSTKGVTVEHIFPEQGIYSGRVTISDNDGGVMNALWPAELEVANSAPVVEMSETVLNAVEDSQFTVSAFGHDTANDTVTYSFNGPGGKIDPQTGVFMWTPLDEHVDKQKFTFIATDEDGGEGTLEVVIHIEDVDNDFLGMSTATGLALIVVMVLVLLVAILIVARQRGMIGSKDDGDEVIESEAKVDLKAEVEVDLTESGPEAVATSVPVTPGSEVAPPPAAPPVKKRAPAQQAPPKRKPPLGPDGKPRKRRPPPLGPDGKPRKRRPPPLGPDGKPRKRRPPPLGPDGKPRKRRPPPLGPDGKPRKRRPPPLGPDGKPRKRRQRPPQE